jgi:protein-S-isoprenylcysteine O-methyltransferase Ste14
MSDGLRLSALALFAVGPLVAAVALLRRGRRPPATRRRVPDWRGYVPAALLPVEWLLPPILIATRAGQVEAGWVPVRVFGLAVGLAGAGLLAWASVRLGRFLVHAAAVQEGHALVVSGPYRFVRHPVYVGYLGLLLGSGLAALNVWVLALWPVSLVGIWIQARAEEELLAAEFGPEYERYAERTGRFFPRLGRRFV